MIGKDTVAGGSGSHPPKTGMMLAAGLGTRMHPITQTLPKPLVKVHGKTLLDYGLDALESAGVERAVVNLHHHPEQIEEHVRSRKAPEIRISDEREALLDSGGGIKKAVPDLGSDPFFVLNSDSFWVEGTKPNLQRMAEFWQADTMDILLLLADMAGAVGFSTKGDFLMDADGRLERRGEQKAAPFAYAGAAIINPEIFADSPDGPFSINILFDKALEQGRLFGLRLDGLWLHVGTPEAIREAEEAIAKSAT